MKKQILATFMLFTPALWGQNPVVTLSETGTYTSAATGTNVSGDDYYQSYMKKNLLNINPGLQPQIRREIYSVATGTTTSFTADNIYDTTPANAYVGYTYYVMCKGQQGSDPGTCAGSSVGATGTVTANTAASYSSSIGVVVSLSGTLSQPLAVHDTVYLIGPTSVATPVSNIGFGTFGWFSNNISGSGAVGIDSTTADLPTPPSPLPKPVQCLKLTNTATGDTSGISTYFDTSTSGPYYYFNGTYTHGISINILSGSGLTIEMSGARNSNSLSWDGTVALSGTGYNNYTYSFTGSENSSTTSGVVQVNYILHGIGSVCLNNTQLYNNADTSPTIWRNQIFTDLAILHPGSIRNHDSSQGSNVLNSIMPQRYRQTQGYSQQNPFLNANVLEIGLHDSMVAAQAAGATRFTYVVPNTYLAADMSNLVDYLAGGAGTTYGSYRIALGQTAPWTSVFSRIILEYGNEVWGGEPGYGIAQYYTTGTFWNYVVLAVNACGQAKANSNWNSAVLKCSATIQRSPAQVVEFQTIDTNNYVDFLNGNEYMQASVTTGCGTTGMWQSAFAEPYTNTHDTASVSGFYQMANAGRLIYVYEGQNSTDSGSCTQAQLTGYPEGFGSGLTEILAHRYANQVFNIQDWNIWQLIQQNTGLSTTGGATSIAEWGIVTAVGGKYNNPRPLIYAMGMSNQCAALGTGYATSITNRPTYNYTGGNGVNNFNNVPLLEAFEFGSGTSRCLLLVNTDQVNSQTLTISGTNAPQGIVTQVTYASTNLIDNNEAANSTPTNFLSTNTLTNPTTYTMTPHSAMTLAWTTGSTPVTPASPVSLRGGIKISGGGVVVH